MLRTGPTVEFDVFLDLRFTLFAFGRLIYGKFDVVAAIAHYDRHQGRIFGRDVLIVKRYIAEKAEHITIKVAPVTHSPKFDVSDDVIYKLNADLFAGHILFDKSGKKNSPVIVAVIVVVGN